MTEPSKEAMERAARIVMKYQPPGKMNFGGLATELALAIDAAVAAEREACAKVCDWHSETFYDQYDPSQADTAEDVARYIRARSESP